MSRGLHTGSIGRAGLVRYVGAVALLVLVALQVCSCCAEVRHATLPRPRLGELPEPVTAVVELEAVAGGAVVARPAAPVDELAIAEFLEAGRPVYVIDAAALDEVLIRRLGHLRELHLAPWWDGPPPSWLHEED